MNPARMPGTAFRHASLRLAIVGLLLFLPRAAPASPPERLVILTPTGTERDGLPVLARHPDAARVVSVLSHGFSGRLLRLYALEQEFLRQRGGRPPEPAYLLLSDRQGGFPRFGFWLGDEKKPDAGWVDLHRGSRPSGRFGAMDQIFPHELLHVIARQLAGEPRQGGSNQMHATGLRTDPVTAFSEGLAEHVQILAVDDPDAAPETRALGRDVEVRRQAEAEFAAYARDLTAGRRWLRPSQLTFLLWFSSAEQVLRYHAVKANLFARSSAPPESLIGRADVYDAYLYQSVVPGAEGGTPKSAGVSLSTEGVVAHLVWRLVTRPEIQGRAIDETLAARFGVRPSDVAPLETAFLKLFAVLEAGRPNDTRELLEGWKRTFPADAADVARVVDESLFGRQLSAAPEIWLANDAATTGTSLFDQYRALPRAHTFDVNAATELDWRGVPGVSREMAARLMEGAPYPNLDRLLHSPDVGPGLADRLRAMAAEMDRLRASGTESELGLGAIARSYLWRLGLTIILTAAAGAALARRAGCRTRSGSGLVGLAASLLVFFFGWVFTGPAALPILAPLLLGGFPWAAWRLLRSRALRAALPPLRVWTFASLPSILLLRSW